MWRWILIDALAATIVLIGWYFCLAWYNRRKGARALHWVEDACSGRAKILESRWNGSCSLQAKLGFAQRWFEHAKVTVRLRPRQAPLSWILSLWNRERETLTFEADLGCAPGFHLQIMRHRWLTQKHSQISQKAAKWELHRPGPVVLTTRSNWSSELTPVVNTLMTSRGHNLLSVRFRPDSPNLAATVALDSLSNEETAASFVKVLRELAAGASAPQ
jgi:hypothetical protein